MFSIQKGVVLIGLAICLVKYTYAQNIEMRTYHDEGKTILKEIYFINDSLSVQLTGPYKSLFINGTIEKEGYYKNNVPDSLWTYYYESGQIKMMGTVKNGSNCGEWKYYYESGNINKVGSIVNSKRESEWKYYYESGELKSQGNFNRGEKEGVWNYFSEDSELKAQAFYNENIGAFKEFYNSGELKAEGIRVGSQNDSTWHFYYKSGDIQAIGDFEEGKRVGPWVFYHENEIIASQGNYIENKKEGKWLSYNENGNLSSEGALRQGKKEGYWKLFNNNGTIKADAVFNSNNGKYTEYYESGEVKAEGEILNGKYNGTWIYYYKDKTKEGKGQYIEGDGDYIGYYRNGSTKMKGKIEDGVNVGLWELYKEDGGLAGYYRPYYEDDKPIYKLVDKENPVRGTYIKPAYKYKSYKSRYFHPVVNEFNGVILATNPLATVFGRLPFSFEYYFEERLGYEVVFTILKDPFYKSSESIELNKVYDSGFDIAVKQKFYHPEGRFGMFYFGHEVRLTSLTHNANVLDSASTNTKKIKINTQETKFEYALFLGDRWMHLFGERTKNNSFGFTLDAFIGIGFGYRMTEKKYSNNSDYDDIFKDINDSKFAISPRIGINIGIVF